MADALDDIFSRLPNEAAPVASGEMDPLDKIFNSLPDEGQAARGSFLSEVGKAAGLGTSYAVGAGLKGAAEQAGAAQYGRAQQGVVLDVLKEMNIEPGAPIPEDRRKEFADKVNAGMGKVQLDDFTKFKTYQAGKAIEDFGTQTFRAAKDYEDSWTQNIVSGLASTAVMGGAALLNPALGFETGVAMSVDQTVQDALRKGASKEKIINATQQAFGPGATEMAPVELLFNMVPTAKWGKLAAGLIKWGAVAAAEGGQEAFQQFWQNLVSRYTYDPKQDLSEQVAKNGLIGLAVGLVFGGGGAIGEMRRGPEPTTPPPAQPPPGAPPGAEPAGAIIPPEEGGPPPGTEARVAPQEPAPERFGEPPPPPGAAAAPLITPEQMAPFVAGAADPEQIAAAKALPEQLQRAAEVPESPRLTAEDRNSPIPNDIIDEGKAAVEQATGEQSKFTTSMDVNGQRQVVTGNVADLVAADKAKTQQMIGQVLSGVSVPQIAPVTGLAGSLASAATEAARVVSPETAAAPAPSIAAPEAAAPALPTPAIRAPMRERPLDQRMAELRARTAAHDAEVEKLASSGPSIRMTANWDSSHKALIGPDMSEPGKFRVTYMDQHGPSGHTVHNTMEDAAREVIGSYHRDGTIKQHVVKADTAYTAGGRDVPVTYAVVDAADLVTSQTDEGVANPSYPQELQPRDRSRVTSATQIDSIARNLNPALLDNNASASDGAPIISADGVVESGNGRVLAIRRAYNEGMPTAQAYRDYLKAQGYPIADMKNPVLVRIRQGAMEQGERTAFTREANERTTLAMSATERALADAAAMSPATMALFRGGEVTEAGNRDFVRGFLQSVVNPNEQGAMVTPDGTLSQEGIRRVQAALLAKAYGNADLVGSLIESPDNNIKAIGNALMDVAGPWAQMRAEAEKGTINPDADITDRLIEAVGLVQRARNEGRALFEVVKQRDIFTGEAMHPDAEGLLSLMFRNTDSWTMPAGREKIAEALGFYVNEARKTTPGVDMLGQAAVEPRAILGEAKGRQYGKEAVQEKLALGGRVAGPHAGAPSGERAVEAQPRPQAEARPSAAPEVRPAEPRTRPYLPKAPEVTEAMREQIRREGEARAKQKALKEKMAAKRAENAAAAEKPGRPKFSVSPLPSLEEIEEPPEYVLTPEEEKQKAALKKRLSQPDMLEAEERMLAVPRTNEKPGDTRPVEVDGKIVQVNDYHGAYEEFGEYGTPEWWTKRRYKVGEEMVTKSEAEAHLRKVADNLAVKEINDVRGKDRDNWNKERAEAGLPPLPKLDPLQPYDVAQDRVAVIIQGPPAAGKSTIANNIAYWLRAAISDVDEAKKVVPEYKGGIGANAVHAESAVMQVEVTTQLRREGRNIVVPTVGDSLKKIEQLRIMFEEDGYEVHLVLLDVSPFTAVNRMIKRFLKTGRLIPTDYFLGVVWKPPYIFGHAQRGDRFGSYTTVHTDDTSDSRVTEATGKIPFLAVGDKFIPTGEIIPRGATSSRGFNQRAETGARPKAKVGEPTATGPPTKQFGPRSVVKEVTGGQIHYRLADRFTREKRNQLFSQLRARLDQLGLKGVDLKVWQQIFADMDNGVFNLDGMYLRETIDVALNAKDPTATLHHEVIHALFDLGLLTDSEKAILLRKAHKEWITDSIKRDYIKSQQAEEGVANAFTNWRAGARMDGIVVKAFKKIQLFLKELARTLTGLDFRNAEDIFAQIESGKIGKRSQYGAGIEVAVPEFARATPKTSISETTGLPEGYGFTRGKGLIDGYWAVTDESGRAATNYFPTKEEAIRAGQQMIASMAATRDRLNAQTRFEQTLAQNLRQGGEVSDSDLQRLNLKQTADFEYLSPVVQRLFGISKMKVREAMGTALRKGYTDFGNEFWRGNAKQALQNAAAYSRGQPTTETVDMFEGPREQYVIPGAEKISNAELAQRKANEKLQPIKPQKDVGGLPLFGDEKNQLSLFAFPATSKGEPRFHLTAPPTTALQATQVQQGFLSRGQPIDRAIRVPFALFGGLDAEGRWNWGKRLNDALGPAGRQGVGIGGVIGAGIGSAVGGPIGGAVGFAAGGTVGAYILTASPNPKGKFGWFAGIAENAKRGLIDAYGLDPAYIEAYRKSDLGKAAILRQAQGIMKVLSNAGVNTPEAEVLQQILTGKPVNDAAMTRLAVPIRQAIDDMGAEAVALGLISPESYQRNRGAYLHRVYAKHEADVNSLSGWVSNRMAIRRKKIIGDELKGRGMFWEVPAARLMQDVESFQKGQRGAAVQGEKFRVMDEVASVPDMLGGPPKEKVVRRVYLPANEAIPAKYQGPAWVNRGEWEVRKAGNTNTLWRDYTEAERAKMGEIVDARYTIAKTFMLMAQDLSTGRFFKEVSEKQEWTRTTPPATAWKDASEYNRYWNDPEIGWVRVPDTEISQTGGKKRWGALAGKWVRSEIWRDLNEINIANNPGTWRTLLTQWKKNKTARHPVVHMNNVMSNVLFMDLADVRAQDFVDGLKSYVNGDVHYQEALDNGAFGSDMASQEIRDNVLRPILDEISKQSTGAGNPLLKRAGMMGALADGIWTWAKKIDNGMLRAYQIEDEVFRMATYMRRRSQGESPQVAAQNARDQFLDYNIRAPWVVAARNSVFPFISYVYRAVPKLAENISDRPWKLAKYFAIAYAVNALSYLWDEGDDKDEKRQRAALRDEEQGYTWLGMPRMIRMPWRDQNGLPVFLDVRRWIPAGDIFDTQQGTSAIPIPAPLHFGGPLQMAFEIALNRQAFTGDDITNNLTQDAGEKFSSVGDFLWKSWMPSSFWTPYSWYWTRIGNALHGATDTGGHPYSVSQAVLSSVGVKVKSLDVQDGIKWHFYDYKKTMNALKEELRSKARQRERGIISEEAFHDELANTMEKFGRLQKNVQEFQKKVAR